MILRGKVQLVLAVLFLAPFLSLPALAMPPVQRMVISNGLVLLVSEGSSLPFVTMGLFVDSGSWKDPPGQEGLSSLTARGLLLGTSQRDAAAINEELDFMGVSLTASSTRDYTAVSLRVLKKDLDKGLDLLMEVLTQPIFPEKELQREVEKTLAAIQSEEDQPGEVAEKAFQKELFGTGPYGHPVEGTKESLPHLTRDAVIRFHRDFYHPNNSILTVVGDITAQEVNARILPRFEKWPKGKIQEEAVVTNFAEAQKTLKIDRPITQANIIIGQAGVRRDNPDYYALTVMNYILGGGGFSSRLMEEIRNKRGLAYSVASFFDYGKYPGSFQIVLQTKNASAREGISLSLQQMERMRKELVSEEEMEGARKYLVGSFPMRFDTQTKLVNFLSQVEYYGLGLDYPEKYPTLIRSVTREAVLRVAQKYLHPDNHILVVVANLKEAGLE
jgi:zinc protease